MIRKIIKDLTVIICVALVALSSLFVSAAEDKKTYNITELSGKYKTQGRTAVVNGAVMLDWTAAGIEWRANCSGDVSITVNATRMSNVTTAGGLFFTVYVDGVMQSADLRIPKDTSDKWTSNSTGYPFHITTLGNSTFTIAKDLPAGEHTFAIYNQTQAHLGAFGVKSITLDGTFLNAPAANDMFVEFVGDSITAAHGNISTTSYDAPLYEDATRGWPFLTAQALGADWSVIARSGITAIDGIGWGGAYSVSMQDVYPYERYYSDTTTLHNFSSRQPDVIVLGLGTNDCWTWSGTGGVTLNNTQKVNGFKAMLTHIRRYNPNAKIIWIYGMMSSGANNQILQAVSDMGGVSNGYYTLQLDMDTSGGNGHPSLAAQSIYAESIVNFINTNGLNPKNNTSNNTSSSTPSSSQNSTTNSSSTPSSSQNSTTNSSSTPSSSKPSASSQSTSPNNASSSAISSSQNGATGNASSTISSSKPDVSSQDTLSNNKPTSSNSNKLPLIAVIGIIIVCIAIAVWTAFIIILIVKNKKQKNETTVIQNDEQS